MMSNARRDRFAPRVVLLLTVAAGLAACGATFGQMPEKLGGLPESVPQRPAETMPFPNVYEPRPVREAKPLTDDEQKKLESELTTLRESQKQRVNPPPPPPKVAAKAAPKIAAKPASKAKTQAADAAKKKQDDSIVPEKKGPVVPLKLVN